MPPPVAAGSRGRVPSEAGSGALGLPHGVNHLPLSHTLCHYYGAVTVNFLISSLFSVNCSYVSLCASNSPLHPAKEEQCMVWECFGGSITPEPQLLCTNTHV